MVYYSEGILLGLSSGAACLAYCGPVLMPYLMGENKNVRTNFIYLSLFLFGRLLAYSVAGLIAGIAGTIFLKSFGLNMVFTGITYIILSVLLILYGFYMFREVCLGRKQAKLNARYFRHMPYMLPVAGGILTGINICPPFLLTITRAASLHEIAGSIVFFVMFFAGTSIYFIPLPFVGIFKKQNIMRAIGKFAAIIAGSLYFYKGVLLLAS